MYPLQDDYIPVIKGLISGLTAQSDLTVVTNAMSTQLCGDWDEVFAVVNQALRRSHAQFGRQVLVCKLIPGALDIDG